MSVGLNLISCFSCSKCLVLPRGSCLWRRGLLWAMVWGWLVVCRVPHKRLRLRFASSLGVGLTSKNEFEENRRRSRHATAPSAHWPPHEVLANHPGGHKVAASPQGSQPGGVTPSRHRPELGHPACGHSVFGGHCSVWSSDSCS